jgi:5,10-methylenetetrahydrofolate reductase
MELSEMTKSRLRAILNSGDFVVSAEITPPHGSDKNSLLERLNVVKGYCDAVNVTDNVRGIPTLSSLVATYLIKQEGQEPVMQMSARDRNRILFESELYGAHALGIPNVLFVTGDHSLLGSHPQTKTVYDIDSVQALALAKHLMSGKDLADDELEGTPQFFLGSTFNPYADPMELQVLRTLKKQDAGAEFFQTQAIFDPGRFNDFMKELGEIEAKILGGIIPLKGPRMARFMNRRIPGIKIPESMIERLEEAGKDLKGRQKIKSVRSEGLSIALETIEAIKKTKGVDGIHIMGIGWEESIPELVKESGLYPRPKGD